MRRHLPVLSYAFQFYAGWIASLTTVAGVLTGGLLGVSGEWALAAGFGVITIALGWAFAVPFWLTGLGLRAGKGWARVLGVVLSVLVLTDLPFGLGLGLLGLGTLLDEDVTRAFSPPQAEVLPTADESLAAARARVQRQLAAAQQA